MFRNFLILIIATWGIPSFALPSTVTLHQSMLFPKLESSFSNWCRLTTPSKSSSCFSRSLISPSAEPISAPVLEKLLNREFTGNLRLNRGGLKRGAVKQALNELLNKNTSRKDSGSLQVTQQEIFDSASEINSPWIDGVLWSPLENGNVLVLQKADREHGINEILVLFSGSQTENF